LVNVSHGLWSSGRLLHTLPLGTLPLGTLPLDTLPLGTLPLDTLMLGKMPLAFLERGKEERKRERLREVERGMRRER